MEIKEAMGYLQAVADNAQSTPKYQRALEMAIGCLEDREAIMAKLMDVEERCRKAELSNRVLKSDNQALVDANLNKVNEIHLLKRELRDERHRFDKASDYSVERDKLIEGLRAQLKEEQDSHDQDVAELEDGLERLARVKDMLLKANAALTEKLNDGTLYRIGGDDED